MSKKAQSTRKSTDCRLIGQPKDISDINVLPTKLDVLRYFEWIRKHLKSEGCHQPEKKVIALPVALKLEELWSKASLPVSSTLLNIMYMILKLHEQCRNTKKSMKKHSSRFKESVNKFKSNTVNRLFDICSCKCEVNNCCCPAAKKVPLIERAFLSDQRSQRLMIIGGCDKRERVKKMGKRIERKSKINASLQKIEKVGLTSESPHIAIEHDLDSLTQTSNEESDYDEDILKREKKMVSTIPVKQELPKTLPLFSRACDRRAISSRAGAQLATALLKDLNVVNCENQTAVVDKSKIFCEKIKSRKAASSTRTSELMALFFDGRKDETITKEVVNGKSVR